MTIQLADGGTVNVLPSGTVEFRREGRTFRTEGRGSYDASARWVESMAYGREVQYVTHNR